MTPELLQIAALCGAFWAAVLLYRGERPLRFVGGLAAGAALAHLGWAALHLPDILRQPGSLLNVSSGFSVLFVPVGLLLVTREAAAFATLPLALAVARLGCLAGGCCHGPAGEPTPMAEIGGLVVLHGLARRLAPHQVVPCVLAGLGLLRLATEPWRAAPPLGEPLLEPALLAGLWVAVGAAWLGSLRLRPRILVGAGLLACLACAGEGGVRRHAEPDERPDYLRYVTFETPDHLQVLLRWRADRMPLRVYLPPAPAALFPNHAEVSRVTREAVLAWSDVVAPGIPSFRFVDDAGESDIPVNWAAQSPGRTVAHVFFDIHIFQRRFGVANLLVTGRYRDGQLATPGDLYVIVAHEIGHALGLGGHSPNPGDVMYGFSGRNDSRPEPRPGDVAAGIPPGTASDLSERDRETLRRLYAAPIGKRIGGARRAY